MVKFGHGSVVRKPRGLPTDHSLVGRDFSKESYTFRGSTLHTKGLPKSRWPFLFFSLFFSCFFSVKISVVIHFLKNSNKKHSGDFCIRFH